MKKVFGKRIYCVITALMLLITSGTQAATVILGYCNNEIKDTDYRNDIQFDAPIQGAIRFTSAQLSAYKGAKITKLRIGTEAGMTKTVDTPVAQPTGCCHQTTGHHRRRMERGYAGFSLYHYRRRDIHRF